MSQSIQAGHPAQAQGFPPSGGPLTPWHMVFAAMLALGGGAGFKASWSSDDAARAVGQLAEESRAVRSELVKVQESMAAGRVDAATIGARLAALESRTERLEAQDATRRR